MYGDVLAFIYTWATSVVTKPGSLAIICLVCAQYVVKPFYDLGEEAPVWVVKATAITVVAVITGINSVSTRMAMRVQNVTTSLKLLAVGLVTLVGVIWLIRYWRNPGTPAYENFHHSFNNSGGSTGGVDHDQASLLKSKLWLAWSLPVSSPTQVGVALLAGLWSYDGWNSVNYVTAELQDPNYTLPRALLLGIPLVTLW